MNFGVIYDEPADTYHATDCVGSHRLQDLTPHPILFYRRWVSKEIPIEPATPAMKFGAYFHALALEGETAADSRFAVVPQTDKRTPAGKVIWENFGKQTRGLLQITKQDYELAWRMVKSIREKPLAVELLTRGKPEVTFRQQMASFAIQARVDWFDPERADAPVLVDVKTISSLADFDSHFLKFGYYKQAAFYRLVVAKILGLEPFQPQFKYIVVEKEEPFQCAVRIPDAQSLEIGTREVMSDLQRLKTCYDSGEWPGEPNEERMVSLPEWKTR